MCRSLRTGSPLAHFPVVAGAALHVVVCAFSHQVLLINAVKDVASALGDLISATKYASGKSQQDPAMTTLRDSAKVGSASPATERRQTSSLNVGRPLLFIFSPVIWL